MHCPVILGSRASALAVRQTELARDALLAQFPDAQITLKSYTTSGDKYLAGNLSEIGNKGLFTKEIEAALLAGDINIAVHSMKDVATTMPEGLIIPCMLPRDDVRDVVLLSGKISLSLRDLPANEIDGKGVLSLLPPGSVVGTSSLRRCVQIRHARPDIHVVNYRGNVQRRLAKLEEGDVDATLLAQAGLDRLHLHHPHAILIPTDVMLPAVGQGAIGLQCRADDQYSRELLETINDILTHHCVSVERHMLRLLDGSCRTPIAGYATCNEGSITLQGMLAAPDASWMRQHSLTASYNEGQALAEEMAALLKI